MAHVSQISFPKNDHIAFIQLSKPSELFQDCWAEGDQRVLIIGLRKGDQRSVREALSHIAERGTYIEEGCLGTRVTGKLKAIVPSEPAKMREFLNDLETHDILTKAEKDKAVHELGVRGQRLHPLIATELDGIGAGL